MGILFTIVHVVICFVLIAVILLQAGRGQGLAGSNFSGGNVQSLFGTRAGDFLTKATTVSAILFLFTCIGLDIIETQKSRSLFAHRQSATPIDVQQIQKVLEKIKAGEIPTPPDEKAAEKVKTANPQPKAAASAKAPSTAQATPSAPEKKS